jgi:hypothetical protein
MLRAFRLCLILFAAAGAARAEVSSPGPAPNSPPPAGPSTSLTAAEEAELAALQSGGWEPTGALRASLGWRDNILLSPFQPAARAFARTELDFMLWRPAHGAWEFLGMFNGDVLRYFNPPPETGGDQQWFLHGETRWQPIDAARLSLKADGFLQDTVIDLSETEATRVALPTRTRGGFLTAAARVKLPRNFTLEPSAQVRRTDYRDFPGDFNETKSGARLEWQRSEALALSAAWFEHTRRYATRNQFTAGGRALSNTRLRLTQREGEVRAVMHGSAGGKWRGAVTLGELHTRDGASGYFDYDERRARVELSWERGPWQISFDGEAKRMEYRVQTVGIGINPPARVMEDFDAVARIERTFAPLWSWFGEEHWERSRGNEREFTYRANTVLAGVQRSF